ncbi:hypothetical protein M427DRAFT_68544 [Gonapodya prolifera JEL478]|uniref:Uncharacterized protein n=1 Tax=Gonapodya prolifera (strain JEL478) TaxID=1344416 RepID=A0A139AKN3_GONPJ|nr:hypothetical protein M427DRAFT_68544 [Gonapodya prolifera JEL478]|eukprot:KXS17094.1 hypothetical protein M427DRAFT_68544 [Gonapodya prolifera JEL478]
MEQPVEDQRFGAIALDPRFSKPRKDKVKVQIDDRFKRVLQDETFGAPPKMDKYGRRIKSKKGDDMRRFYRLKDGEDAATDDTSTGDKPVKIKSAKQKKPGFLETSLVDDTVTAPAPTKASKSPSKRLQKPSNKSNMSNGVSGTRAASAKKGAASPAPQDSDDESDTPGSGGFVDFARGEGAIRSSSEDESEVSDGNVDASDSDESSWDDEDVDNDDGEDVYSKVSMFANESIPTGEETRRFAVVDMDWDNVRATDLYKAFESFKPKGGNVLAVRIYPSEFGRERMEQEAIHGPPADIFPKGAGGDSDDGDSDDAIFKADSGKEFDNEKLRKYQLERLRYYYAIVECDSVSTASAIVRNCDGTEFERTSNFFDLRFVPDVETFDGSPRDVCERPPEGYKPLEFETKALQHSNVALTWDADDPQRVKMTRRRFTREDLVQEDLKAYIASSESEGENGEDADAVRKKYAALLEDGDGEDDGGEKDEDAGQEMEITFTPGLGQGVEELLEKKKEKVKEGDETVFEQQLRKQREKRKRKREERRKGTNGDDSDEKDENEESEDSDALAEEDPFFAEALKKEFVGTKPGKTKTKLDQGKKRPSKNSDETKRSLDELALIADAPGAALDYDQRAILKREKASKKKNKNKKRKHTDAVTEDTFEIDVDDKRFSAALDSHLFAIDPTNPHFKKTKNMSKLMTARQRKSAVGETE